MTIYILKLNTGEDIIGQVEIDLLTYDGFCNIITPMTIVGMRDDDGHTGMRLRDTMMLSKDGSMTIHSSTVSSFYEPSKPMVEYYKAAVTFAMKHTRAAIEQQIKAAVKDLEQMMHEEQDAAERLTNILLRTSRSTLQ